MIMLSRFHPKGQFHLRPKRLPLAIVLASDELQLPRTGARLALPGAAIDTGAALKKLIDGVAAWWRVPQSDAAIGVGNI